MKYVLVYFLIFIIFFYFLKERAFLFISFRERKEVIEREKHWFVVLLIYVFISWFLYMLWWKSKATTSANQYDAIPIWTTWPGLFW